MIVTEQGSIMLDAGEKIVAAVPHKGYLVAITEKGRIFKVHLGGSIEDTEQTSLE